MTLNEVIALQEKELGRSLKKWELNLILDKYNYDKDRLFREAQVVEKSEEILDAATAAKEVTMKLDEAIRKSKFGFGDKQAERQIEVAIEINAVAPSDVGEAQEAMFTLLETIGLLDVETTVYRSSRNHSEIEVAPFTIMVTTVTDENENWTVGEMIKSLEEYCGEFMTETIVSSDGEVVNVKIINFKQPE